eukprot:gene11007-3713_t
MKILLVTLSLFILLAAASSMKKKTKYSIAHSDKPFDISFLKTLTYKQFFKLIRGRKGKHGDVGPRGRRGEQGCQGKSGKRGFCGPEGPRGKPGCQGPNGPKGKRGLCGHQGPRGYTSRKCHSIPYESFNEYHNIGKNIKNLFEEMFTFSGEFDHSFDVYIKTDKNISAFSNLKIQGHQLVGQIDCLVKHEKYNFHGFYNNDKKSYNGTFGYDHENPKIYSFFTFKNFLTKYTVNADPYKYRYQYDRGVEIASRYDGKYEDFMKYSAGMKLNTLKEFELFLSNEIHENLTLGMTIESKNFIERQTYFNMKALYKFKTAELMLKSENNFKLNSLSFYQKFKVPRNVFRIFSMDRYNFYQDEKSYCLDVVRKQQRINQFFDFGLELRETGEISFVSKAQIDENSIIKFKADSKYVYGAIAIKLFVNPSYMFSIGTKMNHKFDFEETGISISLETTE